MSVHQRSLAVSRMAGFAVQLLGGRGALGFEPLINTDER